MELARCMVKTPGARPAVGASKDGLIAVDFLNTGKFRCSDIQRLVPGQFDEPIGAAFVTRTLRTTLQPAPANGRTCNP